MGITTQFDELMKSAKQSRMVLAELIDTGVQDKVAGNGIFAFYTLEFPRIGDLFDGWIDTRVDDVDMRWVGAEKPHDVALGPLRVGDDPVRHTRRSFHHRRVVHPAERRRK